MKKHKWKIISVTLMLLIVGFIGLRYIDCSDPQQEKEYKEFIEDKKKELTNYEVTF
jgi:uncharacterized membrane-anchored protein YhcB (DUF1043 family)